MPVERDVPLITILLGNLSAIGDPQHFDRVLIFSASSVPCLADGSEVPPQFDDVRPGLAACVFDLSRGLDRVAGFDERCREQVGRPSNVLDPSVGANLCEEQRRSGIETAVNLGTSANRFLYSASKRPASNAPACA